MEIAVASNPDIRNIESAVAQPSKDAVAAHGRSVAAEDREIVHAAESRPARSTFKEVLANIPDVGADEDFDFRRG